ncbi:MAG: F0F1 ATP synthase subunit I, partial [Alphaproteobacteria bacterium]
LDWIFGTKPWLLLTFFFLGAIAGVRNMLRAVQQLRTQAQANDKRDGKA